MTAVAVNRDPVAQEPQDRPLGRPLDITGLVEWPLPVGRVDFDEGLAYLHAVDPGGYTTDHLDQAPDDWRRWELLDGVVVVSPAPGYDHQRVVIRLGAILLAAEQGLKRTLVAPFDVPVSLKKRFQPDVLVLPDRETRLPLLAVEVLSRYGRRYDTEEKRVAYQNAGIRSYWIVDPKVPSVTVHLLGGNGCYDVVATIRGDEPCELAEPFPVAFRPADLLT
ncbi:Uma2 family endonuclease [Frankia sp. Cas4]|uniref:Uma2 family endonuclease n=1 Tax=Frankia sp. Cas4 TaxID=3073927 RepID=UPI002AD4FED2|nr:Uma2 family endonuclease [Frankia sp. Cas4]